MSLSKFSQHYLNPNKQSILNWLNSSSFAKTTLQDIQSLDQFSNNYNKLIESLYTQFISDQKQYLTTREQGSPDLQIPSSYFMDVIREYLANNKPTLAKKSTLDLFFNRL
jgi:hypothetical protein